MRPFLLSWALLASAISLLQPSPAPFTLGILRRDALVVPIATYDGKRWDNDWPAPAANVDVPISLQSVPRRWWGPVSARATWQVWTSVASPQLVNVRQPDWVPTYCQKQVGLRTDYQPGVRPPGTDTHPFPKDGLAVSPPQPIVPIDVVPLDSPERGAIAEAIHRNFSEQESAAFKQWASAHLNNPRLPEAPSALELVATPTKNIEALYAYGSTRRTYFVEAAREYKRAGACTAVGFGWGWVVREQGRFSVQSFQMNLASCDRNDVSYMWPLGVMALPTGTFWIAQSSGWDRETYNIVDITQTPKPALNTAGGGC